MFNFFFIFVYFQTFFLYFKLLVLKSGCCKGLIKKDKHTVLIVLLVCILNVDSK